MSEFKTEREQWYIKRAANNAPTLDGYRELGAKAAAAENARDVAIARAEVADHVVTYCRQLIDAALAQDGAQIAIQGLPAGWSLSARAAGRHALLATVWRNDQPMVTVGIATHSRAGATLWRLLIETASPPLQPLDCPSEPWVVARLEPAIVTASRDVVGALGDLERCLGWAWIERAERSG